MRVDQKKPLAGFALVAVLCAVLMGVSTGKGYSLGDVFHVGRPITAPAAAAAEVPRSAVRQEPMKVVIPAELSTPPLGSTGTPAMQQESDDIEVLSAGGTATEKGRTSAAPESAGTATDREAAREQRKADRAAAREQRKTERAAARDERKAERAAAREQRKADRAAARDERKMERAAARDERKADRAAAREQRKAERAAARDERKAERAAAREQRKAERTAARDARKADRAAARDARRAEREAAEASRPGHATPGHGR